MKICKLAVDVFFAGCLFGIEPIIVMPYLDDGVLKEYFFFTFIKFNTALLVFWILYNRYIFRRDSLETSEKSGIIKNKMEQHNPLNYYAFCPKNSDNGQA